LEPTKTHKLSHVKIANNKNQVFPESTIYCSDSQKFVQSPLKGT